MISTIYGLSGKAIVLFNPDPESFLITDIVTGLSRMPRFSGQLPNNYTVAQHSVNVAREVPEEHKLRALMHDAHEAYICDLPAPLKALCPGYIQIQAIMQDAICKQFGIQWNQKGDQIVREADLLLMVNEARQFLPDHEWVKEYDHVPSMKRKIHPLTEKESRHIFLELYHEVKNDF